MKARLLAVETFRFFTVFAALMLLSFAIAQCFDAGTASAQPVAATEHCVPVYDDAYICFFDSFVADAYGDMERATAAFANLAVWQQRSGAVIATNDPTRRALVVYPWDFSQGPMPPAGGDGYVVEMFPNVTLAVARLDRLSFAERAQANLLPVFEPGHEALLVYRRFAACGGAR